MNAPAISPRLWAVFSRYARWYVARNFHAVRLARGGTPDFSSNAPLVIYMNHPAWWDPMIAIVLATRYWPDRRHYAPIDAAALAKYRFFSRLGFFGVEQNSVKGAATFLRTSAQILEQPRAVLWITAGGHFADPRARPVILKPGLGHLLHRTNDVSVIPLALEYPFWEERFPESLARFGKAIATDNAGDRMPEAWTDLLQMELLATQDALAKAAIARQPNDFETILPGRAGVSGIYDGWRSLRSALRGETFSRQHGAIQR